MSELLTIFRVNQMRIPKFYLYIHNYNQKYVAFITPQIIHYHVNLHYDLMMLNYISKKDF
jgi:hypothetical protein